MSSHQRETAFLRHLILYDETVAGQNLEERIKQVERNDRCLRGAVWLMALLTMLAAAGLCSAALFLGDFPQKKTRIIIRMFGGLGLGSLICVPAFAGYWRIQRRALDARREECRRLIVNILESRLGPRRAAPSAETVTEQEALAIVLAANLSSSPTENQPMPERQKESPMNRTQRLCAKLGIVLCGALLAPTGYGQPSVSVGVSVPLPAVEIRAESDFYEPLTPHGEWVVIGSYGRCWRPGHVARDWRPYSNGSWQRTDAGWYWVSDEPWAWATYHYGRWDFTDQDGWYWVPQTQWAPAWVSWHEGGGYVGWAPLQPSVRISASGFVGFNAARISPRAYVFVEQRRFMEPIRPTTVVVNQTTIINKTTTITNTKMVNNTVINEGPATTVIGKASGRTIESVPVQQLRRQSEAAVVAKPRTPAGEKKGQTPVRSEAGPGARNAVTARELPPGEKAAPATPEAAKPGRKVNEAPSEKPKPVPAVPEFKPEARPAPDHPPAVREPIQPKADQRSERQEKPATPAAKKAQRPGKEKPAPNEKNGANPADKDHENKPK